MARFNPVNWAVEAGREALTATPDWSFIAPRIVGLAILARSSRRAGRPGPSAPTSGRSRATRTDGRSPARPAVTALRSERVPDSPNLGGANPEACAYHPHSGGVTGPSSRCCGGHSFGTAYRGGTLGVWSSAHHRHAAAQAASRAPCVRGTTSAQVTLRPVPRPRSRPEIPVSATLTDPIQRDPRRRGPMSDNEQAHTTLAAFTVDSGDAARRLLKAVQRIDEANDNVQIVDAAVVDRGRLRPDQCPPDDRPRRAQERRPGRHPRRRRRGDRRRTCGCRRDGRGRRRPRRPARRDPRHRDRRQVHALRLEGDREEEERRVRPVRGQLGALDRAHRAGDHR